MGLITASGRTKNRQGTTCLPINYLYVHIHIHTMARNISLADDVYLALKKRKKETESFSEVIRRFLQTKPPISEVMGKHLLTPADWEKSKDELTDMQKSSLERLQNEPA